MASPKAHCFEIGIEKGSHGESQIGKVLGDNVGVRLSLADREGEISDAKIDLRPTAE